MATPVPTRLWREPELWVLLAVMVFALLPRLSDLPLWGEEPRRASIAHEINQHRDWVVPRQQGRPFIDRPPLQYWLLASIERLTGRLDRWHIRLPTALATLAVAVLLYVYMRRVAEPTGALAAGLAYPSMGLVLEMGTSGETDGLFAALSAVSLLGWHLTHTARWRLAAPWSIGYGVAALAALTKGTQSLVHVAGVTVVYLLLRRNIRAIFSLGHVAGLIVFAAIVAVWQVPFYRATGWYGVREAWFAPTANRMTATQATWLTHLVVFPLEVFGDMLPWSALLLAVPWPAFRRSLLPAQRDVAQFLIVGAGVVFMPAYLVPYARPRYVLPMFPLVAGLIGLVVDRALAQPSDRWLGLRAALRNYLLIAASAYMIVGVAASIGLAAAGSVHHPWLDLLWHDPGRVTVAAGALIAFGLIVLVQAHHSQREKAGLVITALAVCVFIAYLHIYMTALIPTRNAPASAIAEIRRQLPAGTRLISFGGAHHLFRYHWRDPITLAPWPKADGSGSLPEAFCFTKTADRPTRDLPFAWRVVGEVNMDRWAKPPERARVTVVVGRPQ